MMTPAANRQQKGSTLERLVALPTVFTLRGLLRETHLSRAAASQTLWRWQKEGHIRPLGARVGVYFNLVKDPDWRKHLGEGVRELYPLSAVVGLSVLSPAGWTTQHAEILEVAIPPSARLYQLDGVGLHRRPKAWFKAVHAFSTVGPSGLRALTPAAAIADAAVFGGMPAVSADDIDWPEGKERAAAVTAERSVREALQEVKAVSDRLLERLQPKPRKRPGASSKPPRRTAGQRPR